MALSTFDRTVHSYHYWILTNEQSSRLMTVCTIMYNHVHTYMWTYTLGGQPVCVNRSGPYLPSIKPQYSSCQCGWQGYWFPRRQVRTVIIETIKNISHVCIVCYSTGLLLVCWFFSCSFKHAVYKNLGHFETIDQIRGGRWVKPSCVLVVFQCCEN